MLKKIICEVFFLLCFFTAAIAQKKDYQLFDMSKTKPIASNSILQKATSLQVNAEVLNNLFREEPETFQTILSINNHDVRLVLKRNKTVEAIPVTTSKNGHLQLIKTSGLYYTGVAEQVAGSSLVAFSIYKNEIKALISTATGDYTLTKDSGKTENYTLHRLADKAPFCSTKFLPTEAISANLSLANNGNRNTTSTTLNCPLDLYVEAGNSLYIKFNNNLQQTVDFVAEAFNVVSEFYARDSIALRLSELKVWLSQEPYLSYAPLQDFQNNLPLTRRYQVCSYIATAVLGGGLGSPGFGNCADTSYRDCCMATVDTLAPIYAAMSSLVFIWAHELGHCFGSPHTQACTWPGGPIDNCVIPDDDNCGPGPAPVNGGTLMSYCPYAKFANGLGPLVRQRMLNEINSRTCLCNCNQLNLVVVKTDSGCGNLPSASAIVTGGVPPYTYLWSNGSVTPSIAAVPIGRYSVKVSDANNCTAISGVKIINAQIDTAYISLYNDSSYLTQICGYTRYTLSANPPNAYYDYTWYRNDIEIPGQKTRSLEFFQSGTYKVKVQNGNCSRTSTGFFINTVNINKPILNRGDRISVCHDTSIFLKVLNPQAGIRYIWVRETHLYGKEIIANDTISEITVSQFGYYSVYAMPIGGNGNNYVSCSVRSGEVFALEDRLASALLRVIPAGNVVCPGQPKVLYLISDNTLGLDTTIHYSWYKNGILIPNSDTNFISITQAGAYYASMHTLNCAGVIKNTDTITLTVFPLENAFPLSISGSVNFCYGDSLIISAPQFPQYTYLWLGGLFENGDSSYFVKLKNMQNSITYVMINDSISGCMVLSDIVEVETNRITPATILPSSGKSITIPFNTYVQNLNFLTDTCKYLITSLLRTFNGIPIEGNVSAKVSIDPTVQFNNGIPYVQRHYDIEPAVNPTVSSARVTLYFYQQDFDNYNLVRGTLPALPAGPSDIAGMQNLQVTQFHGIGTNPSNYSGPGTIFFTGFNRTVQWNVVHNWWEVTMFVSGFSGFYVHTGLAPLPLELEFFNGHLLNNYNSLNWKFYCNYTGNENVVLERSTDGRNFNTIYKDIISQTDCHKTFSFVDSFPFAGNNYYRLTFKGPDGIPKYSRVINLTSKTNNFSIIGILPNPVMDESAILQISSSKKRKITIVLFDCVGRAIQKKIITTQSVINNIQLSVSNLASGIYQVYCYSEDGQVRTARFIKK
jgi:hypothetical protein